MRHGHLHFEKRRYDIEMMDFLQKQKKLYQLEKLLIPKKQCGIDSGKDCTK